MEIAAEMIVRKLFGREELSLVSYSIAPRLTTHGWKSVMIWLFIIILYLFFVPFYAFNTAGEYSATWTFVLSLKLSAHVAQDVVILSHIVTSTGAGQVIWFSVENKQLLAFVMLLFYKLLYMNVVCFVIPFLIRDNRFHVEYALYNRKLPTTSFFYLSSLSFFSFLLCFVLFCCLFWVGPAQVCIVSATSTKKAWDDDWSVKRRPGAPITHAHLLTNRIYFHYIKLKQTKSRILYRIL